MKLICLLILCSLSLSLFGQEFLTDLNGFRLRQFREVPRNELYKLMQSKQFEDGFEYEVHLVEPDSTVYMVFEYAPHALQTIWSMQLSGNKQGFDCGFKGLRLGMPKNEIIEILGKPTETEDIGKYGTKWNYEKRNYSVEVRPDGILGSIKVIDKSEKFFGGIKIKYKSGKTGVFFPQSRSKTPAYKEYIHTLMSDNRRKIADILAPDLEIYKKDSVYYFKHAIKSEIRTDKSGVFKLIEQMNDIISKTNFQDTTQYLEATRYTQYQGIQHVAKFYHKNKYSEIVFKYVFGQFLIWEIRINQDEPKPFNKLFKH